MTNPARLLSWRGPPLALQITGLMLGALVVAQVVTLLLTLFLPPEPPAKYDLADIAAAIRAAPDGGGLDREIATSAPDVSGRGWLSSATSRGELARLLGIAPARITLAFYTPLPFAGTVGGPVGGTGGGSGTGTGGARPQAVLTPSLWSDGPAAAPWANADAPALRSAVLLVPAGTSASRALFQLAQAGPGGPAGPGGGPPGGPGGGFPGGGFPGAGFPGSVPPQPRAPSPTQTMPQPSQPPVSQPPVAQAPAAQVPAAQAPTSPAESLPGSASQPFGSGVQVPGAAPAAGGPNAQPPATAAAPFGNPAPVAPAALPFALPPRTLTVPGRQAMPGDDPRPAVADRPAAAAPPQPVRGELAQEPRALTATPRLAPVAPVTLPATRAAVAAGDGASPIARTGLQGAIDRARGLLGLAPVGFVEGDFIAAVALSDGRWIVVHPRSGGLLTAWQKRVALWFLIAFGITAPIGWLFARRLSRPLDRFADAAAQLGRDPAVAIAALDGPAEIGRAAHAFNLMQKRLRSFVDDRTAMVGAISHDLRTPLTRMRFRVEDAPDDIREGLLQEVDDMEEMIASVLAYIRDASSPGVRERLDLRTLLDDVAEDVAVIGADVPVAAETPATVEVEVMGMRRVLGNLVENALKYGEHARMELTVSQDEAIAAVIDDGPGLPDEELEQVFQPFYRTAAARASGAPGTGLGLAVCRSIARAHGGDVRLCRSSEGFRAEVRVPLVYDAMRALAA